MLDKPDRNAVAEHAAATWPLRIWQQWLQGRRRSDKDTEIRYRRVRELFIGAEVVLVVVIGITFPRVGVDRQLSTIFLYMAMVASIFVLHWRFTRDKQFKALRIAMWLAIVILSCIIWTEGGLHDHTFAGIGIVLVYAGILDTRRQFYAMLAATLADIIGLAVARSYGWVHYQLDFGVVDCIDMGVTYVLLGYSIDALAEDLRTMLQRYKDENEKVRQSEAEISHLVHHDHLTGLPNRMIAEKQFNHYRAAAGKTAAVFFIDLDHFKSVNDTLGHAAGDELLRTITMRLSSLIGSDAVLCRIGGDEFLIVSRQSREDAVRTMADRIRVAAGEPVEIGGRTIMPTFSIGIARYPEDGDTFETLARKADIALYSAKTAGRNMFRVYDASMNGKSLNHVYMSGRLRDAVANGEMHVYYQPKISLTTGLVEGAEALLRWLPEGASPVSPDEFIPMAEMSGQIDELGRWVLREACVQCRAWQRDSFPGMKISVNVSAAQFKRGSLAKAVRDALDDSGLDPSCLELELTESLLLHEEFDIGGQIGEIRALGVTFSIDDFGKGYSNLGYLGKLDIGTLKIDRQFIAHMMNTERDRALVGAIFAIAKALNLKTVAEGVETEESIRTLKAFGCSSAQGFYWSKPVEAAAFEAYAIRSRKSARRA